MLTESEPVRTGRDPAGPRPFHRTGSDPPDRVFRQSAAAARRRNRSTSADLKSRAGGRRSG